MNTVELTGTIASRLPLSHFDRGSRLAFTLRCERARRTDFLDVLTWNALADSCNSLEVGDRVRVTGELRKSSWDKDGKRHSRTEVVAAQVVSE